MKNGFHNILHLLSIIGIALLFSTNNAKQKAIDKLSADTLDISLLKANFNASKHELDSIKLLIPQPNGTSEVKPTLKDHYVLTETKGDFEHDMNFLEAMSALGSQAGNSMPKAFYIVSEFQLNDYSIHYTNVMTYESFTEDDKFKMWEEQIPSILNSLNIGNGGKYKVISKKAHVFFSYADASRFLNGK